MGHTPKVSGWAKETVRCKRPRGLPVVFPVQGSCHPGCLGTQQCFLSSRFASLTSGHRAGGRGVLLLRLVHRRALRVPHVPDQLQPDDE